MDRNTESEEKTDPLRSAMLRMNGCEVPDGFTNEVLEKARAKRIGGLSFGFKIAVPAFAAAAALVVFLGLPRFGGEQTPDLASTSDAPQVAGVDTQSSKSRSAEVPPYADTASGIQATIPGPNGNPIPAEKETEIRVDAVKPAPQVRLGGGKAPSSDPSMGAGEIKPELILSILGVDAVYENGGWKVESVTANSIAAKAGVRTGDVIEAVNDIALSNSSVFLRSFSAERLRVRRGSARVTLSLSGD
jgi:membrane-associated protease RseP (regulator of RpoE activity)